MRAIVVIILAAMLCTACTSNKNKAQHHFLKAKEFYKKNQYKDATAEVDSSIKLDISNYDAYILKAKIFSEIEQNNEAIELLKQVLKTNYKTDSVKYLLGQIYFGLGLNYDIRSNDETNSNFAYSNALKFYNDAIKTNTQYYEAYLGKLKVLHNMGKDNESIIFANNAIALFPEKKEIILVKGVSKMELGDIDGALKDFNYIINSNTLDSSQYSQSYRFRGRLYYKKGLLDLAIKDFTKALIFDPNDKLAYWERADVYRDKGLKNSACEDYRKAADLGVVSLYETIREYCGK